MASEPLSRLRNEPSSKARGLQHRPAYWTFDDEAAAKHGYRLYYFAPSNRAEPPYLEQREVTAILDIASDGTLAGVELVMGHLPPPPTSPSPTPSPEPQDVREALKPFAKAADHMEKCRDDRPLWAAVLTGWSQRDSIGLTVGDLRRARAAIAQSDAQPVGAAMKLVEILHLELEEYELRDPEHTPNDFERYMLEDFGTSLLGRLSEQGLLLTAPPRPDALIEAAEWEVIEAMINDVERAEQEFGVTTSYVKSARNAMEAIRTRAADRSASRSDRGGA